MITDEEFIDFTCPYCSDPVSFPAQHRGTLQECLMCYESILVPQNAGEPGSRIPVPFETARLTLRRLAAADWKDLLEFLSDEQMFLYTSGQPLEEEAVLRWLDSDQHVKLTTADQTFYLALNLRDQDKVIGYTGIRLNAPERLQACLNISVNRTFQKQGFAAEALTGLLKICFAGLKLHRVNASCDSRNTPALNLLRKVGLRREGEFVKDTLIGGEWTNTVWHAALREEYQQA